MHRRSSDPSWWLLALLAGLFVLCVVLPRTWEQIARPTSLAMTPHKTIQKSAQRALPTADAEWQMNPPSQAVYTEALTCAEWYTRSIEHVSEKDAVLPAGSGLERYKAGADISVCVGIVAGTDVGKNNIFFSIIIYIAHYNVTNWRANQPCWRICNQIESKAGGAIVVRAACRV